VAGRGCAAALDTAAGSDDAQKAGAQGVRPPRPSRLIEATAIQWGRGQRSAESGCMDHVTTSAQPPLPNKEKNMGGVGRPEPHCEYRRCGSIQRVFLTRCKGEHFAAAMLGRLAVPVVRRTHERTI
jgi:hypothetical protein